MRRYGIPGEWYAWGKFHDRFDVAKEPNEPNRFGWVVEIDPLDPTSTPVKRTAMGRFKHEGAGNVVNGDGRFVVYQGDDERFDYVYRFVTDGKVDPANRAANKDLLDHGTLSVARFNADGTGTWFPLVHGEGPWLNESFGFKDQGDVLIHARLAADLVGATKMDRPEDVDVNLVIGQGLRGADQQRQAQGGPGGRRQSARREQVRAHHRDHARPAATTRRRHSRGRSCSSAAILPSPKWAPHSIRQRARMGGSECRTTVALDSLGRLWVATDGNTPSRTGRADGIWAVETEGKGRGTARCFFQVPRGAEMCGPCPTPDLETFFVAVQHPGEEDGDDPNAEPASFDAPSTRWPDFKDGMPPRPSIVAITRKGGGKIAV